MSTIYRFLWAIITSELARDIAITGARKVADFAYRYAQQELERRSRPKGTSESRELGNNRTRKPR
jgi:hypothetical protein